jgi:hypothetical protein
VSSAGLDGVGDVHLGAPRVVCQTSICRAARRDSTSPSTDSHSPVPPDCLGRRRGRAGAQHAQGRIVLRIRAIRASQVPDHRHDPHAFKLSKGDAAVAREVVEWIEAEVAGPARVSDPPNALPRSCGGRMFGRWRRKPERGPTNPSAWSDGCAQPRRLPTEARCVMGDHRVCVAAGSRTRKPGTGGLWAPVIGGRPEVPDPSRRLIGTEKRR